MCPSSGDLGVLRKKVSSSKRTTAAWRSEGSSFCRCRASAENVAYHQLMLRWMGSKYTLRYSGGMVPDCHHMMAKVGDRGWGYVRAGVCRVGRG